MVERPKRRKSKDNPYSLFIIENKYFVKFTDINNIVQTVEISSAVFNLFDTFELEDLKHLNEVDRHFSLVSYDDEILNENANVSDKSVEDIVESNFTNEELKEAINELPEVQKRRLKKYYFEDMTFEEIAHEENCSKVAIKYSINIALEKISKKIKN